MDVARPLRGDVRSAVVRRVPRSTIADEMNRLFWDEEQAGWFNTADDGEALIARMKGPTDGAVPGGNSVADTALDPSRRR